MLPVMMMMMMMWMEVMALPFPFASSSSSSLSFPRQKRQQSNTEFLCLLVADIEGLDGSVCKSSPSPSPPSCICVPVWQCRDKGVAKEVNGDSLSSLVLDVRSNLKCRAPEEVCCVQVDLHAPPPTPPPINLSCGKRNILGVGNTFLGFEHQQSQYGEFPWTVVVFSELHIETFDIPIFTSSGSLIHEQLVLTVAHAVKGFTADKLNVRLGDWNLDTETEVVPHQDIGVAEVVIHPEYSGDPYHYYDVALLVLERPAALGATINTICLPLNEQDYLPDKCVISGWGTKNFSNSDRFQKVMKAVSMPLVKHAACQTALQQTRLGSGFILHDSFLCAGGEVEGQDACTGDGGSPLVCPLRNDSSIYVQVGVVAWGIKCGRVGVPGVYADVLEVRPWISKVFAEKIGFAIDRRSHLNK